MQGVDIRIIADILGHSTLAMIMRYTHLYDNTKREHIDKISYLGNKEVL
jgi:site-specific recombinase XerD